MHYQGKTPGIWDAYQNTSGSNANGSWHRWPDGTIEQWGVVSLASGTATITFPIAFPTSCGHVTLTSVSSQTTTGSASAWLTSDPSTTTASISGRTFITVAGILSINVGTFNVRWRAIGN